METSGTLNEAVKSKLEQAGINTDPAKLMETLRDARKIYSDIIGEHRWYEDEFCVVEVRGVLIGYAWYHVTGDTSINDMDLDFDINAVCIAERYEKTEVHYRPANIE